MKLRKILASVLASAVAVSAMAVTASAHETFLMYTDNSWLWGCWSAAEFPAGTIDITEDGTYTVFVDNTIPTSQVEDEETGDLVPCTAAGAQVFCVDIDGLAAAKDAGVGADGYEACVTGKDKQAFAESKGIKVSDVKITTTSTDGTTAEIAVNQDNIIFGDIEANGKIRIEIHNAYGDTNNNPAITPDDISFDEKIAVTFTIAGVGAAAVEEDTTVEEAPADDATAGDVDASTDSSKGSPDTGVEDVAVVAGLAIVAAGAVLVSKKRK